MRIGIDIDDTMLHFQDHWKELYLGWFDLPLGETVDDWKGLETATHFGDSEEFFEWYERVNGWATQPNVQGAGGAVDFLLEQQHNVVFVTSRHRDKACGAARDWHVRSPWGEITQLRTKAGNKVAVPTSINVDDSPHVAVAFEEHERQLVLLDRPWNEHVEETDFVHRAFTWHEALELIQVYGQ